MRVNVGGYDFLWACAIEADRDTTGVLIYDAPHGRYANPNSLPLHAHGQGPFVRLRTENLPPEPGVYAVVNGDGDVLYVGRARDSIRRRWSPQGYAVIHARNCFQGGQSTNCRINALIAGQLAQRRPLALWTLTTPDPTPIETNIIGRLRPPWNLKL